VKENRRIQTPPSVRPGRGSFFITRFCQARKRVVLQAVNARVPSALAPRLRWDVWQGAGLRSRAFYWHMISPSIQGIKARRNEAIGYRR
jgi:hypothetical protein